MGQKLETWSIVLTLSQFLELLDIRYYVGDSIVSMDLLELQE